MLSKLILLTRQVGLNEKDRQFFAARGYQTSYLPLIKVAHCSITAETLTAINQADWLFFTSQAPVQAVLEVCRNPRVKIAAIGKATAEVVESCGFQTTFVSQLPAKEAFLREWAAAYQAPQTIFYPKSQLTDQKVEELLGADYQVKSAVTYRNVLPKTSLASLRSLLERRALTSVYLTSPSAWQRFFSVYQDFSAQQLEVIVIGKTTQKAALADGISAKLKRELEQ